MKIDLLMMDEIPNGKRAPRADYTEDDLIAAMKSINALKEYSAELLPRIIRVLREAESETLRNAAALALADLGDGRGAEAIIDVLRRPDVPSSAGTLIYVLDEMGAVLPLDILASIVSHGSFEAKAMSVMMVEEGRVKAPDNAATEASLRDRFLALAVSDDSATAEAAQATLHQLGWAAP